jgi:hypothetical protein
MLTWRQGASRGQMQLVSEVAHELPSSDTVPLLVPHRARWHLSFGCARVASGKEAGSPRWAGRH